MNELIKSIQTSDADVVLLDIDGTIKDLVREHKDALTVTVNGFIRGKTLRKKLVFFLDEIAMGFVKSGVFSTNRRKQFFLLSLYAIILGRSPKYFKYIYNIFYSEKLIVFEGTKNLLESIVKSKKVYLVTINLQNYNLEKFGISREDIICSTYKKKIFAYKKIICENKMDPSKVLIVGDNLLDDIRPAKKLGCKYLLVDNYNSKFKSCFVKFCKTFSAGN